MTDISYIFDVLAETKGGFVTRRASQSFVRSVVVAPVLYVVFVVRVLYTN